jgi:hypothetical protein
MKTAENSRRSKARNAVLVALGSLEPRDRGGGGGRGAVTAIRGL